MKKKIKLWYDYLKKLMGLDKDDDWFYNPLRSILLLFFDTSFWINIKLRLRRTCHL